MPKKTPRAPVRVGRPAFPLGDQDMRVTRQGVPVRPAPRSRVPLDVLPIPSTATPEARAELDALNEIIERYNEEMQD